MFLQNLGCDGSRLAVGPPRVWRWTSIPGTVLLVRSNGCLRAGSPGTCHPAHPPTGGQRGSRASPVGQAGKRDQVRGLFIEVWSESSGAWPLVSGAGFKHSRAPREAVGSWDGEFKRNVKERFVAGESSATVPWDGSFKNSRNFSKVPVTLGVYFGTKFDLRDMRACGTSAEQTCEHVPALGPD